MKSVLSALIVLVGLDGIAAGASSPMPEYQLKAAFLLNFAMFVEWPAATFSSPAEPIVFGVFGKDPFEGALVEGAKGKRINGRPVLIRVSSDPAVLRTCHIVFFPAPEMPGYGKVAKALSGMNILTVGEVSGFTERGGIINFLIQDGQIRFEVNQPAAESRNLKVSSRLLQLAWTGATSRAWH